MRGIFLLHILLSFGVLCFWVTVALGLAWAAAGLCSKRAALRHFLRLSALAVILAGPGLATLFSPHYPVRVPVPAIRQISAAAHAPRDRRPDIDWRLLGMGLAALWAGGVAVVGCQTLLTPPALRRLYRNSEPGRLSEAEMKALAGRVGLSGTWTLRISTQDDLPTALTWGAFKPVILLPREAKSWRPDRLDAVLLHELAHVRRRDGVTGLFAFLVCGLYWFHPGVWMTARAMRQDAEIAADDLVLASGIKPSFYAAELLHLAVSARLGRQSSNLVGASGLKSSKIERRIASIVSPHAHRQPLGRRSMAGILAVLSATVALAILIRPSVSARIVPVTPQDLVRTHNGVLAIFSLGTDRDSAPYRRP